MSYSDDDEEARIYEEENLKEWRGRDMERYICKKCKLSNFTANLKLSHNKACESCGSLELEHDPNWRAKNERR